MELSSGFRLITKKSQVAYVPEVLPEDLIRVDSINLSATDLILQKGKSVTLAANALPLNATIPNIVWSTSNASIATVEDGVVKARGVGSVVITAAAQDGSGTSAQCTIEVLKKLTQIKSIALEPATLTLPSTVSRTLTVALKPADASVTALNWTSSAPNVAKVENGVVTGLSEGSATITATARDGSGKVAQCRVTVTAPPVHVTSLSLNVAQATVEYNRTLTLVPTIQPGNATIKTLSWTSSDPAVATVSKDGVVTAVATGSATITAATEDGSGLFASCDIEVPVIKVESVALDKQQATLKIGKPLTLKTTVLPANAADRSITWSSDDTSVATVSSTGVVTAVAAGTATITATAHDGGGRFASCEVTVPAIKVTKVSLSKTKATVEVGNTLALTATVKPANASFKALNWTSGNSAVATVSSDGVVTAVATGTATITATATDGSGKSAKCTVSVPKIKVASITLDKTEEILPVGNTLTLTPTVLPESASDKSLTWSSSNKKVATVSSTGVVTGVAEGTATITAAAKDGSRVKAICKVTVEKIVVPVTSVSLDKTSETLNVGKTLTLTATVLPENASDKSVIWSTSDKAVATVSSAGVVKGVAAGNATITATAQGGLTATCDVTVVVPVSRINLGQSAATLYPEETLTLTANVLPENATDRAVTWTTSNAAAATVSDAGVITAVAVGNATITATAHDGSGVTATCAVSVVSPDTVGDFTVGNGTVTGYTGKGGAITIPDKDAKGNAITAIGEGAFKDNTSITSVAISAKVTVISESAFEGCTALESVTLPNGVTTIGKAAFKDCKKLTSMTPF